MIGPAEKTGTIAAEVQAPEIELLDAAAGVFRRRWVCLAAMLVVALTLGLNVIPHWIPTPDSALYLSLARSLVRGEGYQADGIPHTLVLPGYPVMLAAIFRVAGEDFLVVNL
ncbi:MAG TPA: hypothetical protein VMZ92_18000, partial [Planctomycetota bacterium]|nr:hypothetical protein [Planctomycetota bacterium]